MKFLVAVAFILFSVGAANECSIAGTQDFLDTLFSSLGSDCELYASLFAEDADYYHQHDGYKTGSQMQANCEGYQKFCGTDCMFLQEDVQTVFKYDVGVCAILAPYIWTQSPANEDNMEPHNGWEYILATTDNGGWKIKKFAEIETTYGVAYNRGDPRDTSVYSWTVDLLNGTASAGECDNPIQADVTDWFDQKPSEWRQQQEAVVLAAGDLCHAAVPYASMEEMELNSGFVIFTLTPSGSSYTVTESAVFPILYTPVVSSSVSLSPSHFFMIVMGLLYWNY